jgi:hypothetical protein
MELGNCLPDATQIAWLIADRCGDAGVDRWGSIKSFQVVRKSYFWMISGVRSTAQFLADHQAINK